jgi:aminoglycoside phosphotransferase (APT) family kinase protein
MGRLDTYSQPGAPDTVLSPDTVLGIARRHTGGAAQVLEVDESGGEARAYLLDGDVVVKTQRPHRLRPRTSLSKEARLLEHFAPHLGAHIPLLLGYGRLDVPEGDVEYLVMTRIPGRATRHADVNGAARRDLVRTVGALLASMHAVDPAPLLADGVLPRYDDGAALRYRFENGFADLADAVAAHTERWTVTPSVTDVAEQAIAMLPETFTATALHSNPGPTHAFCDESGVFTGLIDFGDAYFSHPALDLITWADPADRIALRAAYLEESTVAADFDAAWRVGMISTDIAVIAGRPDLAEAATADLLLRLDG